MAAVSANPNDTPVSHVFISRHFSLCRTQRLNLLSAADVRRETGDMDSAMRKPYIRATGSFSTAFGPSSLPGTEPQALHVPEVPGEFLLDHFPVSLALG
jgi:hypothetical protein